jgi:hypothetical protein
MFIPCSIVLQGWLVAIRRLIMNIHDAEGAISSTIERFLSIHQVNEVKEIPDQLDRDLCEALDDVRWWLFDIFAVLTPPV